MKCLYEHYLSENKNIRVEEGFIIIPDISGYTDLAAES